MITDIKKLSYIINSNTQKGAQFPMLPESTLNIEDKTILGTTNSTITGTQQPIRFRDLRPDKEQDYLVKLKVLAKELLTENAVSEKSLNILLETITKETPLTTEEQKQVSAGERELRTLHKELHTKIRKGDKTPKTVKTIQALHLFTDIYYKKKDEKTKQQRRAEYEEATKNIDPAIKNNSVYRVFYENTNITKADLLKITELVDALDKQKSPLVIKGNKVTVLTREEMWQTKMQILDKAAADIKDGKPPVEIDLEYYELSSPDMIKRIETAAQLGCKIRVITDPGRLVKIQSKAEGPADPAKGKAANNGEEINQYSKDAKLIDASEVINKFRVASYFQDQLGKYDVGVCLYPIIKELGSDANLMHRKVFRVGNKVILGGMNANPSSGENVDVGKLIEGPAAKRIVQIFSHDVQVSQNNKISDILDPDDLALIKEGNIRLNPIGIISLMEIFSGAKTIDNKISSEKIKELLDNLEKQGYAIEKLAYWPDADGDKKITRTDVEAYLSKEVDSSGYLTITSEAGQMVAELLEKTVAKLNSKENRDRLSDISLPSDAVRGDDTMAVADTPHERIAILLNAIASADKFIWVQSFVLTRLAARMIQARQEDLKKQGKNFDTMAIADTSLYPGGGSPNQDGVIELENSNIPSRWALLERTDPYHVRKIHAKEILTDKAILSGSTNLSKKALFSNHELGDITYWSDNPLSIANKQKAIKDFQYTLNKESIEINTRRLADEKFANTNGKDVEIRKDEERKSLTFQSLHHIDTFGKAYAKKVIQPLLKDAKVWAKVKSYTNTGMSKGYATLKAVKETIPEATLLDMKEALPEWKRLTYFAKHGNNTPKLSPAPEKTQPRE